MRAPPDKLRSYLFWTLTALILLAWGALFQQHWLMPQSAMVKSGAAATETASWSPLDFGIVLAMWAVMMIAMMLPSATPTLMAAAKIWQQRGQAVYRLSLAFASGYLGIWLLFSISLTLLQWQLHELQWLSPMMANNNRTLTIALFALAGGYQFSSFKNACLTHCQSPIGFLLNHWQNHIYGAVKMGFRHGLSCLGCCWAMMLLMFAVGVMNLAGMIAITLIITLEKLSPLEPRRSSRAVAVLLLIWAAGLAFA